MEATARFIIFLFILIIFLLIHYKAGGGFSIERMNPIHYIFFFSSMYFYIGSNLIFLGFRNPYVLQHLNESVIDEGFFYLMYGMIAFPLGVLYVNRLVGIKQYQDYYLAYIQSPVFLRDEGRIYPLVWIAMLVCLLSALYTFNVIGYIPQLKVLTGDFRSWVDITLTRQSVSREFQGNTYIRNIFFLGLSTSLSYLSYIYYKSTKMQRWKRMFVIAFILTVLGKTYNFEKAPVLIYFLNFYFIDIFLGKKQDIRKVIKYISGALCLIVLMYLVIMRHQGNFLTLNSGPVARVLFGQLMGFFYHLQVFPAVHDYLYGSGLSSVLDNLFGMEVTVETAARIVMETYNPEGVRSGMAGVENSYYTAEAYANFGIVGLILSPIILATYFTLISNFFLSQKKEPIFMALFLQFVLNFIHGLGSGFLGLIYNPNFFITIYIFFLIKAIANHGKLDLRFKVGNAVLK